MWLPARWLPCCLPHDDGQKIHPLKGFAIFAIKINSFYTQSFDSWHEISLQPAGRRLINADIHVIQATAGQVFVEQDYSNEDWQEWINCWWIFKHQQVVKVYAQNISQVQILSLTLFAVARLLLGPFSFQVKILQNHRQLFLIRLKRTVSQFW